jgi:hypothetical protein
MKRVDDAQLIVRLDGPQRGVFTSTDLRVLLGERHPSAFTRRVQTLVEAGVVQRFARGVYVRPGFDLATLSQRLAPDSYVSFGTVLARKLVIGSRPDKQLIAAKPGRAHAYRGLGFEIVHVQIAAHLDFGHTVENGVRWADAEKAVLDTLYFHLRGRRYTFDVFSDLDLSRLDRTRIAAYLMRFKNPKFVAFARHTLQLP